MTLFSPGFLWVEIDGDALHAAFYDQDGNVDFEQQLTLSDF